MSAAAPTVVRMTNNSNAPQTFPTPTPINTVLDIPGGRVQFTATNRTDTTVRVQPADPAKNRDIKAAQRTTIEYAAGVLHITTAGTSNELFGPSGTIDVTIELPTGSSIQAKAGAAELRTTGQLGDITFDGAYKHINIDQAASLHLTAVDGDITIGRLGGPAHITTARGNIHIAEAARGPVALETHSGDITINAAPSVSATLNASTSYGRVTNSLRNDGNAQLDIRATTSLGSITAQSL